MRNRTIVLLGATLTFLFSSQTAMAIDAFEGAERNEYSIGVVWETANDSMDASESKVNYSLSQMTKDHIAFEGAERDEYSIGVVWETASDSMDASESKVNYSLPQMTEDHIALEKELFPEYEGR